LENRPVVIILNDAALIEKLMDHLVEEGVTKVVGSFVEVSPYVDSRGVVEVAVISSGTGNPYWETDENTAKILVVELVKPLS